MLLQEIFSKRGYKNIIENVNKYKDKFHIEFFYDDHDEVPKELLGIYISMCWDELFFVLNGEEKDINELCEKWDRKISTFMIFGSEEKEILRKMKYNVIQIILHEKADIDTTQEGSLNISRKIILPCTFDERGRALIADDSALELPFVLIMSSEIPEKGKIMSELSNLLPKEGTNVEFLKIPREKKRRGTNGELVKTFADEFEQIKEWLIKNDNTEN